MDFAADYPVLDVLWTMIIFFHWVAWIWLPILIFSDLFRRDVSGWAKAAWVASVIVQPLLGALVHVIAHGKEMTEWRIRDTAALQVHEALA
jgi:general stress protein CsbA